VNGKMGKKSCFGSGVLLDVTNSWILQKINLWTYRLQVVVYLTKTCGIIVCMCLEE
jgi:hypothetical protein